MGLREKGQQLSFLVKQDRRLDGMFLRGESPIGWAEINLSGALRVRRDLNTGDELTITVTDSAGEVIAGGTVEIEKPSFPSIKEKGVVIGVKRVVGMSLTDADLFAPQDFPDDPRSEG